MSSVANDQEDNCLCEAHQNYLIRYMAEELRRQEEASKRFLRERRATGKASAGKPAGDQMGY